jgi:hypothetical protein
VEWKHHWTLAYTAETDSAGYFVNDHKSLHEILKMVRSFIIWFCIHLIISQEFMIYYNRINAGS